MNQHMTDDLVGYHIRDIHGLRHQATPSRSGGRARPAHHWPALRSRVGITLVEAGLHLMVTAVSARSDQA